MYMHVRKKKALQLLASIYLIEKLIMQSMVVQAQPGIFNLFRVEN